MTSRYILWLRWPLGIGVSAASLYALSVQTDLRLAVDVALRASLPHLGLAGALILVSVWAKAVRWRLLLDMPELRIAKLAGASLVGYLFSTFLPFRAGELVRSAVLRHMEGVEVPRSLASVVLEKVFDVASLLLLLMAVAMVSPLPSWAVAASLSAGLGLAALCGSIVLAPKVLNRFGKSLERLWPAFGAAMYGWLSGFTRGLALEVWKPGILVAVTGWSLVAWVLGAVTVWLGLEATGISIPLWGAALVLIVTNLGMAVPSAPGYLGVYHYLVAIALSVYGIDAQRGMAAALVLHLLLFGSLVLFGLAAVAVMGVGLKGLSVAADAQER